MIQDPYATLGLSKGASAADIKSAYRKLVKELHPDARPGDKAAEERFKRVSAAYELIGDPEKRARYDRGEIDGDGNPRSPFQAGGGYGGGQGGGRGDPFESYPFGGRPGGGGAGGPNSPDGFDDLLDAVFGRGARPRRGQSVPQRGADVRVSLEIMLEDAITGQRRRLALSDGRNLDVAIPPGVESGQTLRLKSQGAPGTNGGAPGDALVELTVKPSDRYRREGDDVHAGLKISLTEAVEGGKVPCPTPTGEVALNVPAGSNSGTVLRLRGRGVQREAKPGDLYVTLQVCVPDGDDALKAFVKGWPRRAWVPPER